MISEISRIIWRSWRSHFWTSVATTTVLTLTFSLILGTLLFSTNLSRLLMVWGDEIQVTLYLRDDITAAQKNALESTIQSDPSVASFKYVNKQEAAKSFQKSLSQLGLTEKENPFPASFQVALSHQNKSPEKVAELAQSLGHFAGVEDVSYGQEWIDRKSTRLNSSHLGI